MESVLLLAVVASKSRIDHVIIQHPPTVGRNVLAATSTSERATPKTAQSTESGVHGVRMVIAPLNATVVFANDIELATTRLLHMEVQNVQAPTNTCRLAILTNVPLTAVLRPGLPMVPAPNLVELDPKFVRDLVQIPDQRMEVEVAMVLSGRVDLAK